MQLFKNLKNNRYLFIITVGYLLLGLVNIHFGLLGIFCMMVPMIMLLKTKKKTFCQSYCPRASMLTQVKHVKSKKVRRMPKWLLSKNAKELMLMYFIINLTVVMMTTIMVALHRAEPMLTIRMFLVIPVGEPFQLFHIETIPWLTHMAFRLYSMILSTSVLGIILALVYQPRSWCVICPITTISDQYIKAQKK